MVSDICSGSCKRSRNLKVVMTPKGRIMDKSRVAFQFLMKSTLNSTESVWVL